MRGRRQCQMRLPLATPGYVHPNRRTGSATVTMSMFLVRIAAAASSSACSVVAAMRGARAPRLARFRAAWGLPIERTRRMDAMAASHRARIAATTPRRSLDDRTWRDL